ncbi:MAG: riboflavin synthase [Nitrospirae bacterium]|nr:riboflavin synthase [Nitrospirota bacterium]
MFTGIIETMGKVASVRKAGSGVSLCLKPDLLMQVQLGESIAVNGVCLTVSKITSPLPPLDIFFDVSPETLKNTNLGELKVHDKVNLERALMPTGRFGGHMVTGHIDGVGLIKDKKKDGEYTYFTFGAPPAVLRYLVQKGSVAVDGISLTVIDITESFFKTAIIPHTLNVTTLGLKGIGEKVNLESDILGKYVEKYLSGRDNNAGLMSKLMEGGFTK